MCGNRLYQQNLGFAVDSAQGKYKREPNTVRLAWHARLNSNVAFSSRLSLRSRKGCTIQEAENVKRSGDWLNEGDLAGRRDDGRDGRPDDRAPRRMKIDTLPTPLFLGIPWQHYTAFLCMSIFQFKRPGQLRARNIISKS